MEWTVSISTSLSTFLPRSPHSNPHVWASLSWPIPHIYPLRLHYSSTPKNVSSRLTSQFKRNRVFLCYSSRKTCLKFFISLTTLHVILPKNLWTRKCNQNQERNYYFSWYWCCCSSLYQRRWYDQSKRTDVFYSTWYRKSQRLTYVIKSHIHYLRITNCQCISSNLSDIISLYEIFYSFIELYEYFCLSSSFINTMAKKNAENTDCYQNVSL